MNPLSIAVADDEPRTLQYLQEVLPLLGHKVVVAASNGRELVEECKRLHPDLVITDIKMPDMDGLEAAGLIYEDQPVPIIIVSAHCENDLIERARTQHILAYLVKPIKQSDLAPAIAVSLQRFSELSSLRQEADSLRQALEDRKIIERAKGILMRRNNLDESEAFKRLQKLARDRNKRLAEIAHIILVADEAML